MQSWILCAGLTSSGKGVLQCSPTLPYLLCLEHIFQDAAEVEAEVVEHHHVAHEQQHPLMCLYGVWLEISVLKRLYCRPSNPEGYGEHD